MAELWQNTLKVKRVSVTANFFELGGHSLTALQLLTQIQATFGVHLPAERLFVEPTIEKMAETIEHTSAKGLVRTFNSTEGEAIVVGGSEILGAPYLGKQNGDGLIGHVPNAATPSLGLPLQSFDDVAESPTTSARPAATEVLVPIQTKGSRTPLFCVTRPNVNAMGYLCFSATLATISPYTACRRNWLKGL